MGQASTFMYKCPQTNTSTGLQIGEFISLGESVSKWGKIFPPFQRGWNLSQGLNLSPVSERVEPASRFWGRILT